MSVQIFFLSDLQAAVTSYVQQVLAFYYPSSTPPAIWAYEGGPRPVPPYLSMNVIATKHIGQGYQSPAVPIRDDAGNLIGYGQGVFWNEDPEVSFQAYGPIAPDILGYIHDSFEAPWWHDILASGGVDQSGNPIGLGLVAREHVDPRDISMIIDGAAPERRWVMDVSFGIPAEIDQMDISWIEFVQLSETFVMPDSTAANPDQIALPPVTIGQ